MITNKNLIVLEEEKFLQIIEYLSNLSVQIERVKSQPKYGKWLSTEEACKFLQVTSRTMQNYRDRGTISFSKVGSKLYYKFSDLEELLMKNYHCKFNNNGRRILS
ncbi:helix-turn-helix domain-containing protein [Bacteroidota bacterium]